MVCFRGGRQASTPFLQYWKKKSEYKKGENLNINTLPEMKIITKIFYFRFQDTHIDRMVENRVPRRVSKLKGKKII
jgi:hypothetical protein